MKSIGLPKQHLKVKLEFMCCHHYVSGNYSGIDGYVIVSQRRKCSKQMNVQSRSKQCNIAGEMLQWKAQGLNWWLGWLVLKENSEA